MTVIGFLHTSEVHVPTFRALVAELLPGAEDCHVVDEALLAKARAGRPYADGLAAAVAQLEKADVIVCTCSTIGEAAEGADPRVIRVDRPMAARAVAYGRVGVVAALESTLGPTADLVREEAAAAGWETEIVLAPCLEAWLLFESGDLAGYHETVARHVAALTEVDVVVLAQASMAPVVALLGDHPVPVLASPRIAVEDIAAAVP
ncbi:MAG: hypothetical protein HOV79_33425 [Hamadaea sp.]|nr:hypothetical protein [Hamadaea sp.]